MTMKKNIEFNYFLTNELLEKQDIKSTEHSSYKTEYDFVYHALDIDSKGFSYFIELAKSMPDFTFFIPTSKKIKLKNLTCKDMRWESGLKDIIINSKIILTPSLWSNTPEASMLKSLKFNGCVALIKTKYNFAQELPERTFINLSGRYLKDTKILENIINDDLKIKEYSIEGKKYFQNYVLDSKESLSLLFK